MMFETKNYAIQFPRRVDLESVPVGIIVCRKDSTAKPFAPLQTVFEIHVPRLFAFARKCNRYALQMSRAEAGFPHDILLWPKGYRDRAFEAMDRLGGRISLVKTRCDRRADLGAHPWQLSTHVLHEPDEAQAKAA